MIAAEFNRRKGDFMDETYRIGEVVKGMGVGQYTLKHYERAGLVTPTPDEESGYRYYTYRDFGRLIYVRNLRSMGFSVEGSGEYLAAPFEEMSGQLDTQERENIAEIERLMRANEALTLRRAALDRALECLNRWEEMPLPPIAFVSHFSGDKLNEPFRKVDDADAWRDQYEHADIVMRVTSEALEDEARPCTIEWGIASLEMRPTDKNVEPQSTTGRPTEPRCLAGAFVVNREDDMAPVLSKLVSEELRQRGLHATEAFCVQRAVHKDEDGSLHLLLSVYVPLD